MPLCALDWRNFGHPHVPLYHFFSVPNVAKFWRAIAYGFHTHLAPLSYATNNYSLASPSCNSPVFWNSPVVRLPLAFLLPAFLAFLTCVLAQLISEAIEHRFNLLRCRTSSPLANCTFRFRLFWTKQLSSRCSVFNSVPSGGFVSLLASHWRRLNAR